MKKSVWKRYLPFSKRASWGTDEQQDGGNKWKTMIQNAAVFPNMTSLSNSTSQALDRNISYRFTNGGWKKYSQTPVGQGEIMLSFDAMDSWSTELKRDESQKGGTSICPSRVIYGGIGMPHLSASAVQTEGLIKSHLSSKAKTTYSAIWKRVNKLHINQSKAGRRHHCN